MHSSLKRNKRTPHSLFENHPNVFQRHLVFLFDVFCHKQIIFTTHLAQSYWKKIDGKQRKLSKKNRFLQRKRLMRIFLTALDERIYGLHKDFI